MKIKDLPQPIKELALKRQVEQRGYNFDNIKISKAFIWEDTEEGSIFWNEIDDCNFKPFYDLYPQCVETSKDEFAIGFVKWIIRTCNHDKLKFLNYDELLILFKKEQEL